MKYRELGSTGKKVSEIGFGTWGLGGDSYGPANDKTSKKALRLAFDSGVTFYDTSDLYGSGHSETILGETLKDAREEIIIATKVGTLPHFGFYMPQDFSSQHIKEGLEASLKRLQTDYIDVYQLHSPTIEILRKEKQIIPTLEKLKQEGKIGEYGISVRSPDDAIISIKEFNFKIIQVNFNLIDHRAIDDGLFNLSKKENVGIIARTPFCFGYLTGSLTGDDKFEGKDHRSNWPKEQLKRWAEAPGLFDFLNEGKNRSKPQLALQFCLSDDSVSTVIPGMMNPDHVKENVQTSDLPPLTEEEISKIREIYKNNTFYDKSFGNKREEIRNNATC
jgi:aryl-alcohol dehydrogenase-like predicted oxidoreductase